MQHENVARKRQGTVQAIAGGVKRAFGRLLGHPRTEAEGHAQEMRGHERIDRGMAAERREGTAQEVGGAVKRGVGETVGNERMAAEGRANELEGRERREMNRS